MPNNKRVIIYMAVVLLFFNFVLGTACSEASSKDVDIKKQTSSFIQSLQKNNFKFLFDNNKNCQSEVSSIKKQNPEILHKKLIKEFYDIEEKSFNEYNESYIYISPFMGLIGSNRTESFAIRDLSGFFTNDVKWKILPDIKTQKGLSAINGSPYKHYLVYVTVAYPLNGNGPWLCSMVNTSMCNSNKKDHKKIKESILEFSFEANTGLFINSRILNDATVYQTSDISSGEGDPEIGRQLFTGDRRFFNGARYPCGNCHKFGNHGTSWVGPELTELSTNPSKGSLLSASYYNDPLNHGKSAAYSTDNITEEETKHLKAFFLGGGSRLKKSDLEKASIVDTNNTKNAELINIINDTPFLLENDFGKKMVLTKGTRIYYIDRGKTSIKVKLEDGREGAIWRAYFTGLKAQDQKINDILNAIKPVLVRINKNGTKLKDSVFFFNSTISILNEGTKVELLSAHGPSKMGYVKLDNGKEGWVLGEDFDVIE